MIVSRLERVDQRTLSIGIVSIVVLVCVVQVVYLLWPQWQRFNAATESRRLLVQVRANGEGLADQLSAINQDVDRLSRELHGDAAELPARQMESYIIGRLQAVSWNTDVDLISVKPGLGQQVQMFQERLFEVQLHAKYRDFVSWLQRIGDELGFIVVKRYHLAPMAQTQSDTKLNIGLTMVAYRMVE